MYCRQSGYVSIICFFHRLVFIVFCVMFASDRSPITEFTAVDISGTFAAIIGPLTISHGIAYTQIIKIAIFHIFPKEKQIFHIFGIVIFFRHDKTVTISQLNDPAAANISVSAITVSLLRQLLCVSLPWVSFIVYRFRSPDIILFRFIQNHFFFFKIQRLYGFHIAFSAGKHILRI